jgi:hypothetical protein
MDNKIFDKSPAQHRMLPVEKIKFNRDKKFDLQLSDALINERRLADIFSAKRIEKIELKARHGYGSEPATSALSASRTVSHPASL